MKLTASQIRAFQKKIFDWWKIHRRDLPWRHTYDPYKILVSEIMLQQTQVLRVIPKYAEFIEAYPRISDLARSSPADVLRIWKGMGYNRRALYLQKAAQALVHVYRGRFPKELKELTKIPGVGNYTARAVLVFAYRQDVPLVDTNIRQIITHFFFGDKFQKESAIEDVARQLVPKGKSWEWHQALMDYGALEMQKVKGKRKKGKHKPFKESDRFYRGRIVDALRDKPYPQKELLTRFITLFGKDKKFYTILLTQLEKEGLIVLVRSHYSLPK